MDQNARFCEQFQAVLEKKQKEWIQDWVDLVAQPSVSKTGEGVQECCRMILEKMRRLGIEAEAFPIKPYPVIVGRYGADPEKTTVLIYAHYDVMPVGNEAKWDTPPFVPTVKDGKLYGRGTADNKSPLMAHLEAFDFLKNDWGEVPVNVIFLFEGCEESGSLGLPEFLDAHRDMLKADLVFFSDGPKNEKNIPIIALGAKGNLSVRMTLRSMKKDAHSRFAPVLPSAAWQLVELLGKLKTGEQVQVEGFYDGIVPPSRKERKIYESLPSVLEEMEEIYGAAPCCLPGENYYVKLNTSPTFNIKQLYAGDGAGVVPSEASAVLDIRLVEGQEPEDIFRKLERQVQTLGYEHVELEMQGGVLPSKTPVENPYVPMIEQVTRQVYGDAVIYPCRPSTAPDYLWTKILRLPAIQVRWSDPDSDNHAPNEHLTIAEYLKGIELTAKVLRALGK